MMEGGAPSTPTQVPNRRESASGSRGAVLVPGDVDDELPVSPPTGPRWDDGVAEGIPPAALTSPDRGGVAFLRKELTSTRRQVRELVGTVDSLGTELGDARAEIQRLHAENAALRQRPTAGLDRQLSAPAAMCAPAVVGSPTADPVAALGPELSALIFLEIHNDRIASLHRWGRVCTAWKEALQDDALWRPLCESTWAPLRWPQVSASHETQTGMWHQWFIDAHFSAADTGITAEELSNNRWGFEFKQDQSGMEGATAVFNVDGTFVSTVPSAPSGRRPLPYQLCDEGGPSISVQVKRCECTPAHLSQFFRCNVKSTERVCLFVLRADPALVVSRVGWRWRLESDLVILTELD